MVRRNFLKLIAAGVASAAVGTCSTTKAQKSKPVLFFDPGSKDQSVTANIILQNDRVFVSKIHTNNSSLEDRCYWTEVKDKYEEEISGSVYFSEWCYANTKS